MCTLDPESLSLCPYFSLWSFPLCVLTVRIRLRASCIPITCFTPTLFSWCLRNLQGKCGATRQGHRPMRLQGTLFTFWSFRIFAYMAPASSYMLTYNLWMFGDWAVDRAFLLCCWIFQVALPACLPSSFTFPVFVFFYRPEDRTQGLTGAREAFYL